MDLSTLQDIGKKLLGVAPALAGAILSPNPATVIAAFNSIKAALGVAPDAAEQDVNVALAGMTPDQQLALAAENHRFAEEMGRQEIEKFKAALADVQNARNMNVETTKSTGKRDLNLYVLSYLYVAGFFISTGVMIWAVCNNRFPETMPQAAVFLLGNLFGALTAGVGAIIQYFFGSSKSSADKTEMLANSTPVKPYN